MPEPLIIKVKLDRTQAKAAAKEHVADAQKMTDATKASVAEQKRSLKEVLTDEQVNARAKDSIIQQTNRQRVAAAVSAMKVEKEANAATTQGLKAVGDTGGASFGIISVGIEAAKMGLRTLISLAQGFGQAMTKAGEKSKALGQQFASERDKLAELATVMGEKPTNDFTIKQAKFNVATGMRPDEGLAFRLALNNGGQQFKGKNISAEEYEQFEKQAGELTMAKGFDPKDTGDLAGSILGFKNRTGMGDKASEDARAKLNSGTSILGRGKGSNPVLIRQFNMLAAATLNEDDMKGVFQDSDEVATVISTMAEKHDAQAAEMAQAAIRGMRDFDGKAGDLLKKAGVNHQTKFIDAIKKIAPLVEAEAKEKNVKVEDVLKLHFDDQLTREAVGVAINRGVSGGIFDDRAAFGKTVQGDAPAQAEVDSYKKSERGMDRQAEASVRLAEARRAAETSRVDIVRKQALAKLIQTKKIDTTGTNFEDFLTGAGTFGAFGIDDQVRIDKEAMSMLNMRTPPSTGRISQIANGYTPEGRAAEMNRQIDKIDQAGGNPFQDFVALGGKLDANTAALQANTNALGPKTPTMQPAPTMPPAKTPVVGGLPVR